MTPLIAFGEALVDMLSNRLDGAADDLPETFTPYAGGAPANVAVACARLGLPSRFLGMVGDDRFGDFLVEELARHGVSVENICRTREARTALAFVSRDAHGERRFDFYRPPAADLLYRLEHLPTGVFAEPAILHLCSNSLTDEAIAETTLSIADIARRGGTLISVDANLRTNLWPDNRVDIGRVTALLDHAHLLKLSRDELELLRGDHDVDSWLQWRLAAGVRMIVITDGAAPVIVHRLGKVIDVIPPDVTAVDTTAGGDAFVGGLLAQLAEHDVNAATLGDWCQDEARLRHAVELACRCGAFAVTRPGAYSALPTRDDLDAMY
ncbi:fructokinase [Chromohalobacter marismortui]|uniref:Fructokinase n=1 Tax=Chromohalobacter marismortui TaxID=42055 RepID=A0A4V3F5C8_9GAMM|nr:MULTISPECIES: carbohydrate kinase [Chromohalobacter]MCI0511298.1 carbohydrate kinase [Chromohalobacter sp.]MCI0592258.1 carbohydrate kinase [Chromohalobacter sp.]TDU23686.1 fructokinase [Chromohalobacter marismortui]